jgi:hypothetical protein
MKINDDIQALRDEVTALHQTLEVTNQRLADLADPPVLRPLHDINKVLSIGLFRLAGGPLGKVFGKVMG